MVYSLQTFAAVYRLYCIHSVKGSRAHEGPQHPSRDPANEGIGLRDSFEY